MVSPTWWTWVLASPGSWWWTGKPGMLQSMGSQRVGHDRVTELNWTEHMVLEVRKYLEVFEKLNCRAYERMCGLPEMLPFIHLCTSVQFSLVSQSCPTLQPYELQHARFPCPSPTPGVHTNPCPLSQWCHPTISSSVVPFSSCCQSFPASGLFSNEWAIRIRYWSFSVTISPSNVLYISVKIHKTVHLGLMHITIVIGCLINDSELMVSQFHI